MAGHILGADYPLSVYNRTASRAQKLASRGALPKAFPAEVADDSEVVLTMVSDSPDVEEVIAGSEGVIKAIKPDSVVVDMSTISPQVERDLGQLLQTKGCHLVDNPVSGSDVGAQSASLAIMAGGEP
jgi:3-hydroxyisobutyrate dehydrogenase